MMDRNLNNAVAGAFEDNGDDSPPPKPVVVEDNELPLRILEDDGCPLHGD